MTTALTILAFIVMAGMLYALGGWGLIVLTLISMAIVYTLFGVFAGGVWMVKTVRNNRAE